VRVPGLTQAITVRAQSGVSTAGDATFGQKRTQAARVQQGRDRDSDEKTHTHVVYTDREIQPDDRVWFPGDDTTDDDVARRPIRVDAMRDLGGAVIGWKVLF
jgi:hypothetical protein